ncbi:hypothetical protein AB8P51_08295 [Muriicola sp. SD30]|uniref:hypothetical protein n=1 Tax=Muriicola sp. SD30 TaxID=3240936 RepID=UPI00350F7F54
MKRILLLIFVLVIAVSCKTVEEKKTEEPCTVQARDSLNAVIDELSSSIERLVKTSSKENPVSINLEKVYLEALQKREEIEICLASKNAKSEE